MKIFTLCIAALLATLVGVSNANAQTLTYDLTTSNTVVAGGLVNWAISVTASGFGGADNFGIQSAATDMTDGGGHVLETGVIGSAFAFYGGQSGGTLNTTNNPGVLEEIGVFSFNQSSAIGQTGNEGPHLLATGSFTATNLGTHTLSLSEGQLNSYFGTPNGNYALNFPVTASYTVTAVPEPGSFAMFSVALIGLARRRRS